MMISRFIGNIGISLLLFSIFMMPLAWVIVGSHFDKKYQKLNNPIARAGVFSGLVRALQYVRLIVLGKKFQNRYWKGVFGNINLTKEARIIDLIIAYLTFIPFTVGCVLLFIAELTHLAGN